VAFTRSTCSQAQDLLARILSLDVKMERVNAASKIVVDDNDDMAINNAAQTTAYVSALTARRDALIAQAKAILAGW
jgi:hypothetical protein